MFAEGQLADAKSRSEMTDCVVWTVVEDEVTEVCVGVKTAKIGLAEIHQDLVRALTIADILSVDGFANAK
jgi:hypothetical protein